MIAMKLLLVFVFISVAYSDIPSPMRVAAPEEPSARVRRSAQAEETEPTKPALNLYYHRDVAMVYTKTPPSLTVSQTKTTYKLSALLSNATIQGKSMSVQLNDKTSPESTRYRLQYNFANTDGSGIWSLDSIEVMDIKSLAKELLSPSTKISTSVGYSYHTPSKVVFKSTNYELVFDSFQVQYWGATNHAMRFDVADDTVYFFTIPILSGLFICTLLVTIVLLGLSMIFDIKTMDLFDDPKGKTVTINAAE